MEDATLPPASATTPISEQSEIETILDEIRTLNGQMTADRESIERFRSEMGVLKTETRRLRDETRTTLVRLGADF